jgi:hypothetical protein
MHQHQTIIDPGHSHGVADPGHSHSFTSVLDTTYQRSRGLFVSDPPPNVALPQRASDLALLRAINRAR